MKLSTRKMTVAAVMAALIFVLTFLVHIPIPGALTAYITLGDSVIYITGFVLGGLPALFAAGIGSMLADILSGSAIYAPATLVIKAAMGFVIAYMTFNPSFRRYVLACIVCGAIMVAGYGLYDFLLFKWAVMAADFIGNLIQWGGGIAVAIALYKPALELRKTFRFREEPASK